MRGLLIPLLALAPALQQEVKSPIGHIWRVDRAELLQAIWDGDLDGLRRFIADGADLDAPFVHHADLTENLLSGFRGRSLPPLVAAVETGDLEVVGLVLAHVKDVDAEQAPFEFTALAAAAQLNSPDSDRIVSLLLAAGADIEHPDDGGRTPIIVAAGGGHPTAIARLLEAGADPTHRTSIGTTAHGDASRRNDHLRHLASRMIEFEIRGGRTPLMEASARGRIDDVRRLLAEGAAAGERDDQGWTALMWAAAPGGSLEAVEALLAAGADPDAATTGGWTALMSAAVSRDHRRVAALLAAGADPSAREHVQGIGPLVMSAWHRSPEAFELVAAAGARLYDGRSRHSLESCAQGLKRRDPAFKDRLLEHVESLAWARTPEEVRLIAADVMPWRRPPYIMAGAALDGTKLSVRIYCDVSGWDVAFAVIARQGEREWPIGTLAGQVHGQHARLVAGVDGLSQGTIDLVLRPDPELAARALRTWEIFGDEIVRESVPVAPGRDRP